MFLVIKKKVLIFLLIFFIVAVVCCSSVFLVKATSSSTTTPNFLVVIDAGHGGIDGGSVGKTTGVYESELNLKYANNLKERLKQIGISSVLTRKDGKGLYDSGAKSLKKSDMKKRKEIIENACPTLVVSIHMNSFSSPLARGAQVYYKKGNNQGKEFAQCVQNQLKECVQNTKQNAKVGDFYLVNCTDLPSVLIECGFLSNPEEEKLLTTKDYENKLCYAIMCGIVDYLNIRP